MFIIRVAPFDTWSLAISELTHKSSQMFIPNLVSLSSNTPSNVPYEKYLFSSNTL